MIGHFGSLNFLMISSADGPSGTPSNIFTGKDENFLIFIFILFILYPGFLVFEHPHSWYPDEMSGTSLSFQKDFLFFLLLILKLKHVKTHLILLHNPLTYHWKNKLPW